MKTAYIHANIFGQRNDAFIVENGRFYKVGKARDILKQPIDKIIDLKERTVFPGFHDAHMHLLGMGWMMEMFDAGKPKSIAALIEAARKEKGDHVLGRGFHEENFSEKRSLVKDDLNEIATDRPVLMYRTCGHLIVANQNAIDKALQLHGDYPEDASTYDLDQGFFKEDARDWITEVLGKPSIADLKRMLLAAQDKLLQEGVTAVQSDDLATTKAEYETVIDAFAELAQESRLKIRVYEQANLQTLSRLEDFLRKGFQNQNFGRFRMGPLKLLVDGSLGAHTAYLREPYADRPEEKGLLLYSEEELKTLFETTERAGMDWAVHAIGDGALETILNASESVLPHAKHSQRNAIVHAQLADRAQIERMRALNIGAMVQPIFLRSDYAIIAERLGDRQEETYLFNTMAQRTPTALSTDTPIEPSDPFKNLFTTTTRKTLLDLRKQPFLKEEAMTLENAIKAYTETSAYFARSEHELGSVKKGHRADFVVAGGFDGTPESLLKAEVEETYIDGERVFSARSFANDGSVL